MSRRGLIFRILSISIVVILAGILLLTLYVYKQSVGKFEIRRLSLPTRIYADYTPLKAGAALGPDDIGDKLQRLGYRQSQNLQQATNELLSSLGQNNNLRQQTGLTRTYVAGRNGLSTRLTNVNEATGQPEVVTIVTTQLRNGQLFYMITVAPQNEYGTYQSAFSNILRSLQLNQ